MKRVPILLAVLLVIAACGFAAWFALQPTEFVAEPGGEKETAVALIKSTGGILRSRYGRVFVTFDEPISLAGFPLCTLTWMLTGDRI